MAISDEWRVRPFNYNYHQSWSVHYFCKFCVKFPCHRNPEDFNWCMDFENENGRILRRFEVPVGQSNRIKTIVKLVDPMKEVYS